jgi:hypothetical protein
MLLFLLFVFFYFAVVHGINFEENKIWNFSSPFLFLHNHCTVVSTTLWSEQIEEMEWDGGESGVGVCGRKLRQKSEGGENDVYITVKCKNDNVRIYMRDEE